MGYLVPVHASLLVAVGVVVLGSFAIAVVVGVTLRILQVDILTKVLPSQNLQKNYAWDKTTILAHGEQCSAQNVDAHVAGVVV